MISKTKNQKCFWASTRYHKREWTSIPHRFEPAYLYSPCIFTTHPVTYFPNETTFLHTLICNLSSHSISCCHLFQQIIFVYFQWKQCDTSFCWGRGVGGFCLVGCCLGVSFVWGFRVFCFVLFCFLFFSRKEILYWL